MAIFDTTGIDEKRTAIIWNQRNLTNKFIKKKEAKRGEKEQCVKRIWIERRSSLVFSLFSSI